MQSLQYTFNRLQSLPATWHDTCFTLTELQRYFLELVGLLDYMEVYKPQMDGSHPAPTSVASTVGCFTVKPRVAEEFLAAGLPVWYMRPHKPGFTNNVLTVVEPLVYSDQLATRIHDSFPVLHASNAYISTVEVVGLIHQFSRKWISTPDHFQDPLQTTSSSSTPASHPPSSLAAVSASTSASSSIPTGPPRKKAKLSNVKSASSLSGEPISYPLECNS